MKANLTKREINILEIWKNCQLYDVLRSKNKDKRKFVLHDGPPYANGNIHIGTALNKVLKDITVKSKSMAGYDAPFVPGWDCHGLPIEFNVLKKWEGDKTPSLVRKQCREFAQKFVDIQREDFKRLGIVADWENPYLTMSCEFEAQIAQQLLQLRKSGHLNKGFKPVHWCTECCTALAHAELEYTKHISTAVYVRFDVGDEFKKRLGVEDDTQWSLAVWTTTPWTLPANCAVCLHPQFEYVVAKMENYCVVVAAGLIDAVAATCDVSFEVLYRFRGSDVEGTLCQHPFLDKQVPIVFGEHVNLTQGTGCVHTAPGHGEDDFSVGRKYKLQVICPVDERGIFHDEMFDGHKVTTVNKMVVEKLQKQLLYRHRFEHEYPYCWRCKNPVIMRTTEQWFVSMTNELSQQAIENTSKVEWMPQWGQKRLTSMLATRPDWCVSRQRVWGVPIVSFSCQDCNVEVLDDAVMEHVIQLFSKHSSDVWFERETLDILPQGYKCANCGSHHFDKEDDILDVWFDSGVTHAAVLQQREGLHYPADLYLEGNDQFRGWYQSSLLTATATGKEAPYRAVATHGYVLLPRKKGEEDQKMSKSKKGTSPNEIVNKYGADLLRLWIASNDFRGDVEFSTDKIAQSNYRRVRNTYRYLLGNLSDWDGKHVEYGDLPSLEKYVLSRLYTVNQEVMTAYARYEYHVVVQLFQNFFAVDLSSLYFDIRKDVLYTHKQDATTRRQTQFVLNELLHTSLMWLAPVLSFTAEEIWQHIRSEQDAVSVHLLSFRELPQQYDNAEVTTQWQQLLSMRSQILRMLEAAKNNELFSNFREAEVVLSSEFSALHELFPTLQELLLVSSVSCEDVQGETLTGFGVTGTVVVRNLEGEKCQRCWFYYREDMGDDVHPQVCQRCLAVL